MIGRIALAVASIGILSSCESVTRTGADLVRPDGSQVIYIAEYIGPFDANPGDTVILVMSDDATEYECEEIGGDYQQSHGIDYCVDIDF